MTRAEALARIRKCLALSASSNPHEAAIALKQAQSLMREHGVTSEDVALSDVAEDHRATGAGKVPPAYLIALMHLCADVMGARPILSPRRSRRGWTGGVTFIGVGPRAELAGYAFDVLARQLRAGRRDLLASKRVRRLKRSSRIRRADVYCTAWVEAAREHVVAIALPSEERALVARYCKALDVVEVTGRTRGVHAGDAWAALAGHLDGGAARLHHGLAGREPPRRIGHGA